MRKVLTVGVFDYFHYGHLMLFKHAKELGDILIVAVQEDNSILKYKPNAHMLYSEEQRIEMISSIKYVDQVITYKDVDELIPTVQFDVFARGEDQIHLGFQKATEWCKTNNKEVYILKRTPNICSSEIKEKKSNK